MKALKSDLAKSLLNQPISAKQLAEWLVLREEVVITVHHDGKDVKVVPVIVPKAG
jgi:hypothetical protein